jgi:hypothetical protein
MWEIEYDYILSWLDEQDNDTVASIFGALERLQQDGSSLGRPLIDTLKGSQIKNLKELRPASPGSTEVRILFAFDPERKAIMLLGGDKPTGKSGRAKWSGWYRKAIPAAERLYRQHLDELGGRDDRP